MADFDIVIIGGGIVGLATAYKVQLRHPKLRILVLEKEAELAAHQTGHNSGVIHSGLYYQPGSDKAKTCIAGRKELTAFADKNGIPYKICGKIIVATSDREIPVLDSLLQRGQKNGIDGIERITLTRIRIIEPYCNGTAGLYVPCTGIIDFKEVVRKLAQLVTTQGTDNAVLTSHQVKKFRQNGQLTEVITTRGSFQTRYLINCAGLHADRIARMQGFEPNIRIIPFRGDYYELTEEGAEKVKNLIYPVPDPLFPFLGVHFTRTIHGQVECGPNAVFSCKREGYGKFDFSPVDTWQSLAFPGTWMLFMKHWRYGLAEYRRAISKTLFLKQLQRLIPSLDMNDIRPGKSGVRAQAIGPKGQLIDDFLIEKCGNCIHVLNAPSPAATASLSIGDAITEMATQYFGLNSKTVTSHR